MSMDDKTGTLPTGGAVGELDINFPFPNDDKASWAMRKMMEAQDKVYKWRTAAREADRFHAGKHYPREDMDKLQSEGRPNAMFNVAQKFIRFAAGIEENSRMELNYVPRNVLNDQQRAAGSLVTKAYEWSLQNCNGHDERSRAFVDCLVRGMGWTDTQFDRTIDPSGMIKLARIDGHEMWWDVYDQQKNNLDDARWLARERQIPVDVAKRRWPKFATEIAQQSGQSDSMGKPQFSYLYTEKIAKPMDAQNWPSVKAGFVRLIEFQWFDEVPGVYFVDPIEGKDDWMEEKEYDSYVRKLRKILGHPSDWEPDGDRMLVRKYQRMLICGRTVIAGPAELPGKRFTFNCITGQWDADEEVWYGYMRLLMDPQRYSTKFANQMMEVIVRGAKGGAIAEADAFRNVVEAEDKWSKAGSLIIVQPGAVQNKKIMPKPPAEIPPGSEGLFKLSVEMLNNVTGLNPEATMGMGTGDEPSVTMIQRQRAALLLLATEFGSLNRYLVHEGQTVFDFLKFIADDRLIRVGGMYDGQAVKLIRDPFFLEYDVILTQNTRDPNVREQYRQTIEKILPTLIRTNNFEPDLLDFFDIPEEMRFKLKQRFIQQAQAQQKLAAQGLGQGRGKGNSFAEIQARVEKLKADAELARAKAVAQTENMRTSRMKTLLEGIIQKNASTSEELQQGYELGKDVMEQLKGNSGGQPTSTKEAA